MNPEEQYPYEGSEPGQHSTHSHITRLSQQGYRLLREGRTSEAERCFHEILDYDAWNHYALVGLGDAARKQGDCKHAVDHYKRCLEHHPDNNYALFGLADCYKSMRRYRQAITVWEKYLHHDDENVTVLTRVADAHRKVRNFNRSKQLYDRVLTLEEDNAYALIGLGHLYYDFKDYERALEYWYRMVDIKGGAVDIRVLTSIGNCYRKLGKFSTAVDYFSRTLKRDPDNFYALFGLADCSRGLGDHASALSYWDRILSRDPQNKLVLTRAADAYRALGQPQRAEAYYRKALDVEFDLYAVLGLALLSMDEGHYEKAAQSLESVLGSAAKNARVWTTLAECYLKLGRRAEALSLLESYPRSGKGDTPVVRMLQRLRGDRK
ncbi:MAG: tetratricopeptide repeat protein [Spirochaetaceae bacterium]